MQGSDQAAELAILGLFLVALEDGLDALAGRMQAQEARLLELADRVARTRRRLAALPAEAGDVHALAEALGAAQVQLLRSRGQQDQLWAEVERRGRVAAHVRRVWESAERSAAWRQ